MIETQEKVKKDMRILVYKQTDDGCGCKQPDIIKLEGMSTIMATWDSMACNENKEKFNMKLTNMYYVIMSCW